MFPIRPNRKECRSHLVYPILHTFVENAIPQRMSKTMACLHPMPNASTVCKRERVIIKITRGKVIINPIPTQCNELNEQGKESSEYLIQQDYHHRTSHEPREHHPGPFLPRSRILKASGRTGWIRDRCRLRDRRLHRESGFDNDHLAIRGPSRCLNDHLRSRRGRSGRVRRSCSVDCGVMCHIVTVSITIIFIVYGGGGCGGLTSGTC